MAKQKMTHRNIFIRDDHWNLLNDLAQEYSDQGEETTTSELVRLSIYRFLIASGKIQKK